MEAVSPKRVVKRNYFPVALMKKMVDGIVNEGPAVEKQQLKSALVTLFDDVEGKSFIEKRKEVGFDSVILKKLRSSLKKATKSLESLNSADSEKVSSIYQTLSIQEDPSKTLEQKVVELRQALSASIYSTETDIKRHTVLRDTYDAYTKQYLDQRKTVMKEWRKDYSSYLHHLEEQAAKEFNSVKTVTRGLRGEELVAAKAANAEKLRTINDALRVKLTDSNAIGAYFGKGDEHSVRMVQVFSLRKHIEDISHQTIRVSHSGQAVSVIAEHICTELARGVREAYCLRLNTSGGKQFPVPQDVFESTFTGMASPLFKQNKTLRNSGMVTYTDGYKDILTPVKNICKGVCEKYDKQVYNLFASIIMDSIITLSENLKNNVHGSKTITHHNFFYVLNPIYSFYGEDATPLIKVVQEAFTRPVKA